MLLVENSSLLVIERLVVVVAISSTLFVTESGSRILFHAHTFCTDSSFVAQLSPLRKTVEHIASKIITFGSHIHVLWTPLNDSSLYFGLDWLCYQSWPLTDVYRTSSFAPIIMADSIIERNRQLHEEIDRTSIEAVKELCTAGRSHREKIHGEHRVMHMAERISQCSRELTEFYNDLDGSREAEIKAVSGPNEFSEFYTRLQIIRDKHRAQHRSIVEPMRLDFASVEDSINGDMTGQALVKFSGEEGHGRYLDLHTLYDTYLNLRFVEEKLDYTEYVSTFDRLFSIDRKNKKKAYRR